MGGGWRRAFCTTIPPRNSSTDSPSPVVFGDILETQQQQQQQQQQQENAVPRKIGGFFKSYSFGSNPSTPRSSTWSLRSKSINNNNAPPSLLDDDDTNNYNTISSSNSNSSTPRLGLGLRLRPNKKNIVDDNDKFHSSVIDNLNITPRLRCKTNTKKPKSSSSLVSSSGSNPSSPRSPFSIFKTSLGFSRSNCGLCLQSVKTGHKTAIFTAECSHTFHFPCISKHFLDQQKLACPICKSTWRDASFLSINNTHDFNNNKQLSVPVLLHTDDTTDHVTRSQINTNFIKPKPYNDDEPLRTPRATSGIVPIPEAFNENEEDDNDDDEFKGFFANPVVSSSSSSTSGFNKNVDVLLISEVAVISSTQSHETYALILKVKAPPPAPPNESRRAPIDLVAVLDVNASMGGPKLEMLKRAMRLVISSLASADRLSIVAFSASPPKRLLPLRRMTSKGQRSARRIIDHLASSTSTCSTSTRFAGEALKKATQVLEDRRERNPVASIILLSDGHQADNDNSIQRQVSSQASSTRFAHVEIPVHTTPAGYTNQTHDYHSSIEEDAFTKCVGGLLSVVAQDLRVQLDVAPGSDPAEITAVYSCNGKPMVLNAGSVRFGDLYAEEEREVLVEMRVPRSNSGTSQSHHVLSARCSYNDPATQKIIYGGEKALLVPRAHITVRSSPKMERLRNLFIATRAVAESRLLVEYNKLTTAHHLLSSARALLLQSSMSGEEFVKGLESELVDIQWRVQYQQHLVQQQQQMVDENGEPLTPTSARRAAEKLAKVAVMNKSFNRVSDLHGFENARF